MRRIAALPIAIGLVMMVGIGAAFASPQATASSAVGTTPTPDDITLLRKSVDAVQKSAVVVASDLKVRGSGNGVFITINEVIRVTGHFPGKFHSYVRLLDEDGKTTATQYEVTGDGTNVYTYRPSTKQYGVQSADVFKANFGALVPSVGVLCGVIASGQSWGDGDTPLTTDAVREFLDAVKKSGFILEVAPGDQGRRVFTLRPVTEDASGMHIQMIADPVTGGFVNMEMSGKQGEMKFSIRESIRSLAKVSVDVAGAFTFAPPADAKKVDKLAVWPF